MSEEEVGTMARLHAERLMRGEDVSEAEMRIVTAGLMLAVDELSHAVRGLKTQLWPEAILRQIIGEEVAKYCAARGSPCAGSGGGALWVGRVLRSLLGMK